MLLRIEIGSITKTTKGSKMRVGRNFVKKKLKRFLVIKKGRGQSINQINCSENTIPPPPKDKGTLDCICNALAVARMC